MFHFQDLKIVSKLGDGSFGIVHKGEWTQTNGTVIAVAVKVLKSDIVEQNAVYNDFVQEVQAMHSLQHPSLIRYSQSLVCDIFNLSDLFV